MGEQYSWQSMVNDKDLGFEDAKLEDEATLGRDVPEDDNYDVFGDAEWLRASKQLQADLGAGKDDLPSEFRAHDDSSVKEEAGADDFGAEVRVDDDQSSSLDFKSLELGVKLFDDQAFGSQPGDDEDSYDDDPDEDGFWADDEEDELVDDRDEDEIEAWDSSEDDEEEDE